MQSNVDITTNEANLDIKYGMLNLREERELARASFKYIASDMNNIQKYYIKLGFHLCEAKNCKYYEDFGYDKFEDFVAANFGMEKSALSRCMNVYLRFFAKVQHDPVIIGCPREKNKYEDYSYSQLCELVSIPDDKIKEITSDMTVKQIREFKKNMLKSSPSPAPAGNDKENSSDESSFIEFFVEQEKTDIPSLVKICKTGKDNKERAKKFQKLLAPYGHHGVHTCRFSYEFLGFSHGIDFTIGLNKKQHMSYICFVKLFMEFMSISELGDNNKQVATSQPDDTIEGQEEKSKSIYKSFDSREFKKDLFDCIKEFVLETGIKAIMLGQSSLNTFKIQDANGNVYTITIDKKKKS